MKNLIALDKFINSLHPYGKDLAKIIKKRVNNIVNENLRTLHHNGLTNVRVTYYYEELIGRKSSKDKYLVKVLRINFKLKNSKLLRLDIRVKIKGNIIDSYDEEIIYYQNLKSML
jgi:hypothetical protein